MRVLLSIVCQVYKTGRMAGALVEQLMEHVTPITADFEIILVDDGCPHHSWRDIEQVCKTDPRVKGIKLSRNFGQHSAITAGLANAGGEWIVVMDSDLQDRPAEIPRLYQEAMKGFDIVVARRSARTDSWIRKFYSRVFNAFLSALSGTPSDHRTANFGIYRSQVIRNIVSMPEYNRFFPMMVNWVGFNKTTIEIEHGQRGEGTSGYNLHALLTLALNTTLSYSDKPLRYVVKAGFIISVFTFLYALLVLFRYFRGEIIVLGYTSLVISIWFLGGILLFTVGMVGLYVGKIFEEVKGRPTFIIEKKLN
jgi:glycosyltransferase involved in cell wall biosynthesis